MISADDRFQQQRKIWLYFLDPHARYALIPLFLGLASVEAALGKGMLLLGLSWLGGALALDRARPSDREMDEILSRDAEALEEKAMRRLEPRDDEMRAAPLVLRGPVERDSAAYYPFLTRPRTGRDGGLRSPLNRVMILLPLEDHLGIYSCHHDSVRGITSQVSTEECHYRDVVSVTLDADVEAEGGQVQEGRPSLPTRTFSLELASGRCLSIPVSCGCAAADGVQMAGLGKTVQAFRTLLRDKR